MKKREAFEYACMLGCLLGLVVLIITAVVPVAASTQALMSYSCLVVAIIMGTHKYRSISKGRH